MNNIIQVYSAKTGVYGGAVRNHKGVGIAAHHLTTVQIQCHLILIRSPSCIQRIVLGISEIVRTSYEIGSRRGSSTLRSIPSYKRIAFTSETIMIIPIVFILTTSRS